MLMLGAGYTALAAVPRLRVLGFQIFATARSDEKARLLRGMNITPLAFDSSSGSELRKHIARASHILISVPPADNREDPVLAALPVGKIAQNCEWAGYLSATSVYGDKGGHWAFEDELLRPSTDRGRARANAEIGWIETGLPVHIFRLAGIYGPRIPAMARGRNPFERLAAGRNKAVIKPGHVSNRIHVDDIGSALLASLARPNPLRIYNIADGDPAPPQDVLQFAAKLSGHSIERVPFEQANMTIMARSFYAECRRTAIDRAKSELGWAPKFASYQEGLRAIYAQDF